MSENKKIIYTKDPESIKLEEGEKLVQNTTGHMIYERTRPPPPVGGYDRSRPNAPVGGYNRSRPSAPKGGYNRTRPSRPPGGYNRSRPTPNNQYIVTKVNDEKKEEIGKKI